MALTAYENATTRLLQNPPAPTSLYATADIDTWINSARNQLAGESESVRVIATVATAVGNRVYPFSGITVSGTSGVNQVLHVRRVSYSVATGQRWITPRPWSWFDFYYLANNPVPVNGPPLRWSQFAQGALGSLYIDPPPDQIYTLNFDCVCLPVTLTSDSTPEAIPYPWTDAIPYFAAYLALLSAQSPARQADAQRYLQMYESFVDRARQFSNPDIVRHQYLQAPDPTLPSKLGLTKAGGGGQ